VTDDQRKQHLVAGGIGVSRIEELERLIGVPAGRSPNAGVPVIAPLLLFQQLSAFARLPHHPAGNGLLLIQEYLAIETERGLEAGQPLIVDEKTPSGDPDAATVRIDVDLLAGDESIVSNTKANLRSVATNALQSLPDMPLERLANASDLSRFNTEPVSAERIENYVRLAGDPNPLHTDPEYIRASDLPGPVVPGALMAGFAESAIMEFVNPEWISLLRIRFTAPVTAGEAVGIAIQNRGSRKADGRQNLRLYYHRPNGNVTAIADARIRV
jgi:acyl dehydratase